MRVKVGGVGLVDSASPVESLLHDGEDIRQRSFETARFACLLRMKLLRFQ